MYNVEFFNRVKPTELYANDDISEPRPEIWDGILAVFLKWLAAQNQKLCTNPNAVGYTPYALENDGHCTDKRTPNVC